MQTTVSHCLDNTTQFEAQIFPKQRTLVGPEDLWMTTHWHKRHSNCLWTGVLYLSIPCGTSKNESISCFGIGTIACAWESVESLTYNQNS